MTDSLPIASFLIPVYNGEAYLAESMDSALAQTEKNIEIIAIDDGSTDSSREILRRYAAQDPRVHVFEEKHQGLVAALNRGLEVAQGKYICRLDADDLATPDRIEKQVKFLEDHPDYALVGGQVTIITTQGQPIRDHHHLVSAEEVNTRLRIGNAFNHSTVTFRRAEALRLGGYDPAFLLAEDYDLWVRMAANYRLGNLPDNICRYRIHASQTSPTNQLRQTFTATCILATFRGISREAIREAVQAEDKHLVTALRQLGYSDDEIAEAFTIGCLVRVAELNSVGIRELALRLLSQLENILKHIKGSSRYRAQTYSWEFIVSAQSHNIPRAARGLFRALISAPLKTAKNILGRMLGSVTIVRTRPVSEGPLQS